MRRRKKETPKSVQERRSQQLKKELDEQDMWINGYKHEGSLTAYINERIRRKTNWANQITFEGMPDRIAIMNKRRKQCSKHCKAAG